MADNDLRRLLDLEEIKKLRIQYSHYLDGNHLDELALLFTPDAICEAGRGTWKGRAEIRAGLAEAFLAYDRDRAGTYPFLHAITNHWIEFIDDKTAQGRCYLLDLETASKPSPDPWLLLGTYADEYIRTNGQWLISRTRLDVVWPERNGGGGRPGIDLVLPNKE